QAPAADHRLPGEASGSRRQRPGQPRNCHAVAGRRLHRNDREEATRLKNFAALTRMRIQLTLRNKMFLFFSVIMPFGFFFLYAGVFARGIPHVVRYFMAPVLALTVMGSFWGRSAALVMFRDQGILRRFHVSPVTPSDM